jgi:hypothetical protein
MPSSWVSRVRYTLPANLMAREGEGGRTRDEDAEVEARGGVVDRLLQVQRGYQHSSRIPASINSTPPRALVQR